MRKTINKCNDATSAKDLVRIWQAKLNEAHTVTTIHTNQERSLFNRFTELHKHLASQPRKLRRNLTRNSRLSLLDIAFMLAMGFALPASATDILVNTNVPSVNRDGLCSLMEAINNANNDTQTSRDCPAGSGADTIILQSGSTHTITKSIARRPDAGLTAITSRITIEGDDSTIHVAAVPVDLVFNVGTRGDLTLNDTTISGDTGTGSGTDGPRIHNTGIVQLNNVNIILNSEKVSAITNAGIGDLKANDLDIYSGADCSIDYGCYTGHGVFNAGNMMLSNTIIRDIFPHDYHAAFVNEGTLELSNVSIMDNRAGTANNTGMANAGILNSGDIDGTNVSLTNNYSFYGVGGIDNQEGATLVLRDSVITGNGSNTKYGGRAFINNEGEVSFFHTKIENNGGLISSNGYLNLTDTSVINNYGSWEGGLISNGETILNGATVSRNSGYGFGGLSINGIATITNSTITENGCGTCTPIIMHGDISIDNSTIAGNYDYINNGVLFGGVVSLSHTVITGFFSNTYPSTTPRILTNEGILNSEYNLFGDSSISNAEAFTGFTPGSTDITATSDGTNPTPLNEILELELNLRGDLLIPRLADNGGPTPTVALVAGSPAIDAGGTTCEPTDQRGISRPQGTACDIGAFEVFTGTPPPSDPVISKFGVASVNHNWTTFTSGDMPISPVVIAGPPSFNGGDPGVARVRNVGSSGFDIRFQEYDYRDGWHTQEQIPYLVAQEGRHVMPDGSIWEAGTFSHFGTPNWKPQQFTESFPGVPHLFLTVQTFNAGSAVTARANNVTVSGFDIGFFEQESLMDGHVGETVGYLAIYSPSGSGSIEIDGASVPYNMQQTSINHNWAAVLGKQLKLEEEKSKDNEIWHTFEKIDAMDLGGSLFGQIVSSNGGDPAALRQRSE